MDKSKKMSKRRCIIIISVIVLFLLIYIVPKAVQYIRTDNTYRAAEKLAFEGTYIQAEKLFQSIYSDNYKDTKALLSYCQANRSLSGGDVSYAHYIMQKIRFSYISEDEKAAIASFNQTLDSEYDAYLEELGAKEAAAAEERIKKGIPYVGMSENDIGKTSLGRPSETVKHNYECIGGEQYLANIYDFARGGRTVFTARCVRGAVTEVWDNRNTAETTKRSTKKNSAVTEDDPYDADEYSDPDDFYEDHYDDFSDHDEADFYYYDHNG